MKKFKGGDKVWVSVRLNEEKPCKRTCESCGTVLPSKKRVWKYYPMKSKVADSYMDEGKVRYSLEMPPLVAFTNANTFGTKKEAVAECKRLNAEKT